MSIESLGRVGRCFYCERLCNTFDNVAKHYDCLECDSQPGGEVTVNEIDAQGLNTLSEIFDYLPEYKSPYWDTQPNNLRCDVDTAKKRLLKFISHTHKAGAKDIDTCDICGRDLRHKIHIKENP